MDDKVIISTIKKVMPAVVSIMISKHLEDLEKEVPPDLIPFMPGGPEGKKLNIPDNMIDARGMVMIGGGSGFLVHANGIILTNKHVINDPKAEYTVILNDGRKLPGEVLSRDPINDVAILKIQADNLPILELGDARHLDLG